MADRDEGATVRLAATIARSRHEADGGTLLDGIHPDTIVEMSLAAKREVDSLRAELEEERRRNSLGLVPCVKCGNYEVVGQPCSWCRALATRRSAESRAEAAEASIALERVTIAEMKLEAHQLRTNLHIARIERDAARADLARMTRAIADERAAVAIAHERMDALTAERDARPEISREDARWVSAQDPIDEDQWTPSAIPAVKRINAALRDHAAGSGNGGDDA